MTAFWDKFKRMPRVGAKKAPVVSPSSPAKGSATEPAKEAPKKPVAKGDTKEAARVLIRPILTEKASRLAAGRQYVFAVRRNATRIAVARAIHALYGVRPEKVNILNMQGKAVRFGRVTGKEKDWKKAIVTMPPGKTIAIYEGV